METVKYVIVVGSLMSGIVLGVFGGPSLGSAAEPFIIASSVPKRTPDGVFGDLFIPEAYRRVGIDADVEHYPPKRCSILANNGNIDGEVERVFDYSTMYPNLIRVDVIIRTFTFAVYAVKPNMSLAGEGWDIFNKTPYKVEYQRGIKKAQEILTKLVPPENLSEIDHIKQGIQKLERGRTDLFVTFAHWMQQELHAEEFRESPIYQVSIVEEVPLYTYLHKKHHDLVPKLAEALGQMKAEGLLDTYLHQAYQE